MKELEENRSCVVSISNNIFIELGLIFSNSVKKVLYQKDNYSQIKKDWGHEDVKRKTIC